MTFTLTREQFFVILNAWAVCFLLLANTGYNRLELLNIVGFLSLLFIPGMLTTIALQLKGLSVWMHIALAAAFSILELMIIGLAGNTLLPFFAVVRPLDSPYVISEIAILVVVLSVIAWRRMNTLTIVIRRWICFDTLRNFAYAFAPALFVFLSVLGAIRLNNGQSGALTAVMLAGMTLYTLLLVRNAETLEEGVLPTGLFFMALSLLLMTSLRGWYITGHDIQAEYKVFELAKNAGIWSIGLYRDAYNACLSITILPTIFGNIMRVADPYIYKFFFQIIFALSAPVVYFISRNWISARLSFLAGLYFIAFPTFFEDMPFLIRQEIAFLFFGLMIYLLFEEKLALHVRRLLFVCMGIGVILSHYSTTYTVLVIFALSVFSAPLLSKLLNRLSRSSVFKNSALLSEQRQNSPIEKRRVTLGMLGILITCTFVWTFIVTDTGGQLGKVMVATLTTIEQGFTENSRSIDAVSLITLGKQSKEEDIRDYTTRVVTPTVAKGYAGEYFDQGFYASYSPLPLKETILPLTSIGQFLTGHGIPIAFILGIVGQFIAKLMELAVVLGIIFVVFRRSIIRSIDNEYYLLAWYSLLFIGINIVLPVLSTEYGVFRALQQSMFVLAPFMVAGTVAIGVLLAKAVQWTIARFAGGVDAASGPLREAERFATGAVILFFIYATTLLPQLFGGNSPALHLNNTGVYYDNYLVHKPELYGTLWLQNMAHESAQSGVPFDLQADRYSQNKIASLTNLQFSGDIFPMLIMKDSYVFLSVANFENHESTISYHGTFITYEYPLAYLDATKALVYNNGSVRIYR